MKSTAPALEQVLRRAAQAWQLVRGGQSLERAIQTAVYGEAALRPAVQDVATTAVRHLALIDAALAKLVRRPPPAELAALLAVALAQLIRERHAAYTVVDQAVSAARSGTGDSTSAGFVNGVLRNFLRQREALVAELSRSQNVRYNAPTWWLELLQQAQPECWQAIAETFTEAPPLVLRINRRRVTVTEYLTRLAIEGAVATRVGAAAVWLHRPRPVDDIPGFAAGEVSVQDAGAQLAAAWLSVCDGQRVLDACAAPGGKTAHLTELAELDLTAVDIDGERARRIEDNLQRIGQRAQVLVADAVRPAQWWDGQPYQRILLDAPCTASGIVRRHPDIPWLRRPSDVAQLATRQAALLDALWPLLEADGRLLYVVCSLFPAEGREQVTRFLTRTPDARAVLLPVGLPMIQLTPTAAAAPAWDGAMTAPTLHDGFFYALLEKTR